MGAFFQSGFKLEGSVSVSIQATFAVYLGAHQRNEVRWLGRELVGELFIVGY